MPVKNLNIVDIAVGHNVKILRVQRGISQGELGEALGVTFQQVQKYEKGKNRISSGRLSAIADYFNIDVAALFSGTRNAEESGTIVLFSPEAVAVAQAYDKIQSVRVRHAIRSLVRQLSQEDGDTPPDA
ncbi:helix-turn-helix transcriptional regulator [Rhizobium sp. BK251]|uniref:helix-turn-helix domain-containing protein n=1 Tax=Rhizobium sp. BK251 TaxID=2512125 RepID=UPI0010DEF3C4|nr:helix-turn-helix transcriptional regulator [Rhizobium sp. BK251]TCL63632.1 transcriptional regulator with XRE-family HTH domain [Rhizobium sp. BK251]